MVALWRSNGSAHWRTEPVGLGTISQCANELKTVDIQVVSKPRSIRGSFSPSLGQIKSPTISSSRANYLIVLQDGLQNCEE